MEPPHTGSVYLLVGKALVGDGWAAAVARTLLAEPETGKERSRTDLLERNSF